MTYDSKGSLPNTARRRDVQEWTIQPKYLLKRKPTNNQRCADSHQQENKNEQKK